MRLSVFCRCSGVAAALLAAAGLLAQSGAASLRPRSLPLVLWPAAAQDAAPGCRPGDREIGRQETADEIIVYCSRISCDQMAAHLRQDMEAQRRLMHSMEENNADLEDWAKRNEAAQQAAFKDATDALFRSLLSFSAARVDAKIVRLQNELNRSGPEGETLAARLARARAFEAAYARWSGISDGLKIGVAQGVTAADTWVSLQQWAAKAQPASNAMLAAWNDISNDSKLRGLLRNEGLDFAFQTLKQGLSPLLSGSFSMAKFLLNYGYDAGAWNASRQQILQRSQQADQNLLAECKLARLIEIDVRNLNVCNHRLPAPEAPDPEDIRCSSGH